MRHRIVGAVLFLALALCWIAPSALAAPAFPSISVTPADGSSIATGTPSVAFEVQTLPHLTGVQVVVSTQNVLSGNDPSFLAGDFLAQSMIFLFESDAYWPAPR